MSATLYRVVVRSFKGDYERVVASRKTEWSADRIETGLLVNLNHDEFYVEVEEETGEGWTEDADLGRRIERWSMKLRDAREEADSRVVVVPTTLHGARAAVTLDGSIMALFWDTGLLGPEDGDDASDAMEFARRTAVQMRHKLYVALSEGGR